MADNGSSRWNGRYGTQEVRRRENYGRGIEMLKDRMDVTRGKGYVPELQKGRQMAEARDIDRVVPRRKD